VAKVKKPTPMPKTPMAPKGLVFAKGNGKDGQSATGVCFRNGWYPSQCQPIIKGKGGPEVWRNGGQ